MNDSLTDLGISKIFYAGCLDSDPFESLKQCDRIVVSGLKDRGVGVRELQKELPSGKFYRKLNRNVFYPRLVTKATGSLFPTPNLKPKTSNLKLPILHISSQCYAHLIPKAGCPVSITVHDLAEHYFPEDMTQAQMRRWEKRMACLKQADLIFCISEHTKRDLIQLLDIPEEKLVVNYNGISDSFQRLEEATRNSLPNPAPGAFKILTVGTNIYRKNLTTLLRAVAILKEREIPVVLVKTGESLITSHASLVTQLNLSESIFDLGYVSEDELNRLYNTCDVLAFPSLYEGFGLPVIEAQKCGLPCVVSNAASLPEIGGDGALYHEPEDAYKLADLLQQVCKDSELSNNLRGKGFVNASRFSWDLHLISLIHGWNSIS